MSRQIIYLAIGIFFLISCGEDTSEMNETENKDVIDENIVEDENSVDEDNIFDEEEEVNWRMISACYIGDYQELALMVLTWHPEDENGIHPIDGYYYYVKHQKRLDLEGYSEPATRKIYLNESYKGKPTGYIMFLQDDLEDESYWAPSKESHEHQEFNQEELLSGDIYELDIVLNNSKYYYEHQIEMYNGEDVDADMVDVTDELDVFNINDEYLLFVLSVTGQNGHTGYANGIAKIDGNTAIWESDEDINCRLIFDLTHDGEISVREEKCSYYHGAYAYFDGVYTVKE